MAKAWSNSNPSSGSECILSLFLYIIIQIMKSQQPLPKFQPIGFVLRFDPPIIGLLYHPIENKRINQKKKKCYAIHLNNLIFLVEPEEIVEQLYQEHPDFLIPEIIKPEQVFKLVLRLVAYRDHQLQNLRADGGEYYEEDEYEEEPQVVQKGKGRASDNNKSF